LLLERIEPGTKVSDEPRIPPVHEAAELLTGLRETASYDAGQLPTMGHAHLRLVGSAAVYPGVPPVPAVRP
jgi:hypothetical protein